MVAGAAPYFSNLVWFIGNHVLELDDCVRNDAEKYGNLLKCLTTAFLNPKFVILAIKARELADLVAEHLDHLHYLNDILCLEIGDLNCVLTDQLLLRLLMPLYVHCRWLREVV
jgi:protein CLEC16A